jgi:uncharacterized protein with GYD domain
MAGLMAQPEGRAKALTDLFSAVGGRLIDHYVTLGEHDFLVIAEGPDEKAILAALLPVAASGAVTDLKTCVAYRAADVAAAVQKAKAVTYRPPGKA